MPRILKTISFINHAPRRLLGIIMRRLLGIIMAGRKIKMEISDEQYGFVQWKEADTALDIPNTNRAIN